MFCDMLLTRRSGGLRRTEFNFRGQAVFHQDRSITAKIEFCTSEPKFEDHRTLGKLTLPTHTSFPTS